MPGLDDLWFPHLAVLLADDDKVVRRRPPGSLPAPDDDLSITGDQGVPPEALLAGADWPVVPDHAERVLAAGADAGVLAVVVEACEAGGALPVILTVSLPATGQLHRYHPCCIHHHLHCTKGSPLYPAGHLQVAVSPVGTQSAPGPQGFGSHGSGFSLQPVMVSGAGT